MDAALATVVANALVRTSRFDPPLPLSEVLSTRSYDEDPDGLDDAYEESLLEAAGKILLYHLALLHSDGNA